MDFKISINNDDNGETYLFPLFESTSAVSIKPLTEAEFIYNSYNTLPETKFFEYTQA